MEGSLNELLRIPSPSGDWECQELCLPTHLEDQRLQCSKTSHNLRVRFSFRFERILLFGASRELPFEKDGIRG